MKVGTYRCAGSCINEDIGYANLSAAWDRCADVSECTKIIYSHDSAANTTTYHLRDANDVYSVITDGTGLYVDYGCAHQGILPLAVVSCWPGLRLSDAAGGSVNQSPVKRTIAGVVNYWGFVTAFKVNVSNDGSIWTEVDNQAIYTANNEAPSDTVQNLFTTPVNARFLRIVVTMSLQLPFTCEMPTMCIL